MFYFGQMDEYKYFKEITNLKTLRLLEHEGVTESDHGLFSEVEKLIKDAT